MKREGRVSKKLKTWGGLVLCMWMATLLGGAAPLKYTEDRLPSNLNPLYADDMYSERITELIFERMIGWNRDQKPVPMLATSWTIAPDKKSITLTLRKKVKWHDGKPFTSKDVAFTIKAMTSRRSQITDRYLAQIIKAVKTPSAHTVTIVFKKPLNKPVKWLQFKIIPEHRFKGKMPKRTNYFSQKPYGTGPFKFHRWMGKKIKMRRFKGHWRASKIRLKGAMLQAIPDKNIQVEVLRYGGIHAIVRVRPKDIPVFERDQNIRLYPYSTNDWWYLGLNQKRGKVFRDKRVREAFMYALDRDNLRSAQLGDGQTISGPFSPNDPLYNFNVMPRGQDREKAGKLLDQAGWKKGAGGIRRKGGKTLKIRLVLPKSKESYRALCLAVQSELRKIGVKVDLVWKPDAAWKKMVFKRGDFDMTLHIWNFDDLSSIYPLFHSKGSRNYIGFKSKKVDTLLTKATKTTDPVIYKAIYGKLHKVLHKELPYLFLWSLTNYSSISARVKNVTIHPFNYFHFAYSWYKKAEN
ncbi:MAG TPA: hypothetical protein DCE42_00785 [Myxococcales bacterium]|nr:hypothetical protein [Deltaproteobacteria bacterium]HAA53255.1 hypothetical protein [Myxococcales bacterium]